MQTGPDTMQVSWTAPGVPPGGGYRITVNLSASADAIASPQSIIISTPGVHSIRVMSLSQHLPGGVVELEGVIVNGENIFKKLCDLVLVCPDLVLSQCF